MIEIGRDHELAGPESLSLIVFRNNKGPGPPLNGLADVQPLRGGLAFHFSALCCSAFQRSLEKAAVMCRPFNLALWAARNLGSEQPGRHDSRLPKN